MTFRSLVDRAFVGSRPLERFAERRDRDVPPISDEAYDRIPDKFKEPSEDDRRNDGPPPPPPTPNAPRRSPLPFMFMMLAAGALIYFGYHAFFTAKTSEITWTAFNEALDEDLLESAEIRGTTIECEFRSFPTLAQWARFMPNGRELFTGEIARYDKRDASRAAKLEALLKDELADRKTEWNRKTTAPDSPIVATLTLKTGEKTTKELASDASQAEIEAALLSLVDDYLLKRRIELRWTLKEIGDGRFVRDARQMVDVATGKTTGQIFFKHCVCETPPFAFSDPTLDQRLRDRLRAYTSTPPADGSRWMTILSGVIMIAFFIFIFRMMRNTREQFMNGGNFGVSKSLAKEYDPSTAKRVTFEDVAGMDQVKAELIEVVDYLKNPAKYERMGARVPKGTLLFGPPGTGKTLLARAVAGEANVPFYSINGSEFIQMFVGVGASRVRDLFATAKEHAPSILFIDEIDAVGRQRGAGVGGGQDEREQTLNQILSEMDGFAENMSVMVMASTNRPDVLDPALMRPGRFDRHITVGRPSMKGRVDIFKVYLKKIPYSKDVDVDKLAKQTSGFTGADIRNYVNEATLWATRNNKNVVEASDFEFAFEKIALGLRRDETITEENKRKTAYHEAGHAVVGWFLPNGSKVHKVTIIPRGLALGVTWSLPDEDKLSCDAKEARATLAGLLAGRAAEKLAFGDTTSGVENDLQRATELARDMVARWGMSERLGPASFPNSETHPFLGREMTTDTRAYSEATAEIIDEEIKRILTEADAEATRILMEKRAKFEALADALVEEEEVDATRLREILGPSPSEPAPTDGDRDAANAGAAKVDKEAFDALYGEIADAIRAPKDAKSAKDEDDD